MRAVAAALAARSGADAAAATRADPAEALRADAAGDALRADAGADELRADATGAIGADGAEAIRASLRTGGATGGDGGTTRGSLDDVEPVLAPPARGVPIGDGDGDGGAARPRGTDVGDATIVGDEGVATFALATPGATATRAGDGADTATSRLRAAGADVVSIAVVTGVETGIERGSEESEADAGAATLAAPSASDPSILKTTAAAATKPATPSAANATLRPLPGRARDIEGPAAAALASTWIGAATVAPGAVVRGADDTTESGSAGAAAPATASDANASVASGSANGCDTRVASASNRGEAAASGAASRAARSAAANSRASA